MKIAVLGCGNMGRAIIAGVIKKFGRNVSLIAYDKSTSALAGLPPRAKAMPPRAWFIKKNVPDIVLLAVKPQDMHTAISEITSCGKDGPVSSALWLSIAAGVSIAKLEGFLGPEARICRAMPNTPALIGEAVSAYALNSRCKSTDARLAEKILGSFGLVTQVPEKMMDAITGLSGSGPAYVYLFLEALIEGGVTAGLPYDTARMCAVQTLIGAARMVEKSELSPAVLKSKVMSPGGTTAKGLLQLEKHGFKYGIIRAVTDAARQSAFLGK